MEGQLDRPDEVTEQVARLSTSENRSLLILYGSETGNAEEVASELRDMTERLHFYCEMGEMDSFKLVCYSSSHTQELQLGLLTHDADLSVRYSSFYAGDLCYIYHWPRGYAYKHNKVLEKPQKGQAQQHKLSGKDEVRHLWSGR